MQDLAQLSDLARAEIDELKAEGIDLTAEEVIEINALAWAVETPSHRIHLSRGVPVIVAGVSLWPLTLYAADWYCRVGCKYDGDLADYALAYAMAHSYDEGDALDLDYDAAPKAIKRWVKSLRCRRHALIEAVSQVIYQDEMLTSPQGADGKAMTPGDFSAFLASVAGGTPEFWERSVSFTYCQTMLATIVMQNRSDKKPCAQDPRIIATRLLGEATNRIRESRKEKANV